MLGYYVIIVICVVVIYVVIDKVTSTLFSLLLYMNISLSYGKPETLWINLAFLLVNSAWITHRIYDI